MASQSSSSSSSASIAELHDEVLRHDMFALLCSSLLDYDRDLRHSIARRLRGRRVLPSTVAELQQESSDLSQLRAALATAHAEYYNAAHRFTALLEKAHSDTALAALAAQRDTEMAAHTSAVRHAQKALDAYRVVSLLERIASYGVERKAAQPVPPDAVRRASLDSTPPPSSQITRRASLGQIERRRSLLLASSPALEADEDDEEQANK